MPAYLIAGGIVGPGALGLIASPESLDAIGRLALLLLMFGVGLELHLSTFRRDAIWLLAAGLLA
ncbi:MAG: cation/H(+) antiporter, partial [Planctomycetota bacterium]